DARIARAASEFPLAPADDRFLLSAKVENAVDHLVAAATLGSDEVTDALFMRVAGWKGLAFRAGVRSRTRLLQDPTPSQRESVSRWEALKAELPSAAYARGITDHDAQARRLAQLQERKRQLDGELQRSLDLEREKLQITSRDLGALLPQGAAFLDLSVLDTW